MKEEYDFSGGKRGAVVPLPPGKTRVKIPIDDDILDWFRARAHQMGGGDCQALINAALREYIETRKEPLEEMLRRVIRKEISPHP